MKVANATKFYRKSGVAEGSAVQRTFRGNVFRQWSGLMFGLRRAGKALWFWLAVDQMPHDRRASDITEHALLYLAIYDG
jgi:hypothetical protein